MKKFIFLFILVFNILFVTRPIFAHSGGGPPFVTVNGELAQTNPYYQGTSSINVPQDTVKKTFLPNEAITLTVDPSQLPIPEDVVAKSQFTWIFFSGDNFVTQMGTGDAGTSITQSFAKPGSYLVNVYLTYQGDPQLLDTIQLNVLPTKNYTLPHVTVGISQFANDLTDPVTFSSLPVVDTTSSVSKSYWDIGDGKIVEADELQHTYETSSFVSFLYHRIVDTQGLVSDVGFQTQGINGKISFVPFPNTLTSPFTLHITKVPTSLFSDTTVTVIVLLLISIFLAFLFLKIRVRIVK